MFNTPILINVNKYINGIVVLSYYQFNGLTILNIINKKNKNICNILNYFNPFNNLEVVGVFEYQNNKIIDYYFKYDFFNEVALKEVKEYHFLDFFDVKINKGNLKVRRDRHFY